MRGVVRRRHPGDGRDMAALVTDSLEAVEPGLEVLRSGALVGEARIDLIARDARGGLVLVVVGHIADDDMLVRVLEGSACCRDSPDALRHLSGVGWEETPPVRAILVAERFPDAFLRKLTLLDLPVRCVGLWPVEVDGTATVCVEPVSALEETDPRVDQPVIDAVWRAALAEAAGRAGPGGSPKGALAGNPGLADGQVWLTAIATLIQRFGAGPPAPAPPPAPTASAGGDSQGSFLARVSWVPSGRPTA